MRSSVKSGAERRPVDVALAYLDALGSDDPATVTSLVADDFVNDHVAELGSGCAGRDEYARRLPGFFAMFRKRRYRVERIAVGELVDPDDSRPTTEVVVEYRFDAEVDGTRIDLPGVMWISVRDGAVTRRLDSWDSLTFQRQTGTPVD